MEFLFGILFSLLLWIGLPILFLVWLVRLMVRNVGGHKDNKPKQELTDRDVIMGFLILAAGTSGLSGVFGIAENVFGGTGTPSGFASLIISAMLLLVVGYVLRGLSGKFLMVLGVIVLAMALPSVFSNLGDIGTFFLILVAFIGLIVAAIKIGKSREVHEG